MNGDFETADGKFIVGPDGRAVRGTFPKHWGTPPADLEERGRWIQGNIREGEKRMDRGEKVPGQRPKTGRQAMASLRRRPANPEIVYRVNQMRLRLMDLRARR